MIKRISNWYSAILCIALFLPGAGCDLFEPDEPPAVERPICSALDASSTQEFLDNNNTANFEQLNNDQRVFLFTSSLAAAPLDGNNVIELTFARVDFDFEDETVDPHDLGGFWARWRLVIVPFDRAILEEFENANTPKKLSDLLNLLRNAVDRTEVQLSGPFLRTGCEWGDTDEIGTQTLNYSNYSIYDWDFFPGSDRVLGILFEGDRGVNDDFISWLDISKNSGQIVLEESEKYRIELLALSDVSILP